MAHRVPPLPLRPSGISSSSHSAADGGAAASAPSGFVGPGISSSSPGSASGGGGGGRRPEDAPSQTARPSSSLPLQVCLSFNALLSLAAAVLWGVTALDKLLHFRYRSDLQELVLLPSLVVWLLAEVLRLVFALWGNRTENVPQMATFLLLSLFPQVPVTLYMGFFQEIAFPVDYALSVMLLVFLIVQLSMGYRTLKGFIRRQTAQFVRLCQEEELAVLAKNSGNSSAVAAPTARR